MQWLSFAARGLLIGATAGSVAALADQLIRAFDPALAASSTAVFAVVVYWAVILAPIGLIVGLGCGAATRWTDATLGALAFCALVGGYVNQRWLPGLLDPVALAFDAALIAAVAVLAVLAVRAAHRFDLRVRVAALVLIGIWGGTGLASTRARHAAELPPSSAIAQGPDVLVVLLDALRADHCSSYGYGRETTPELDRLASEGLRFSRAYSVSSWTKPVVATLFSGLHPVRHQNHPKNALLPDELVTLPELFREAGYRTSVFAENNFVSPLFGYDQGVEHFEGSDPSVFTQSILGHMVDRLAGTRPGLDWVLRASRTLDRLDAGHRRFAPDGIDLPERVAEWTKGLPDDDRFFTYVHLLKPHAPYRVPEEFEGLWSGPGSEDALMPPTVTGVGPFAKADAPGEEELRHLVDNYDERIRFGDAQLGEILDGMRALGRDPLVVVLSDHGEEFGENGLFDHGHSLQEAAVRVPLVIRWTGRLPAGVEVGGDVRLLDLPASLLSWADIPVPPAFDGSAFADFDDGPPSPRPLVLELWHGPGFGARALVRDRLKFVYSEEGGRRIDELFALDEDPAEANSVAVSGEDPLVWMSAELETLVDVLHGRGTYSAETTIDPATEERLRALGYAN
jgi:arylsulfatase A-like enzyme